MNSYVLILVRIIDWVKSVSEGEPIIELTPKLVYKHMSHRSLTAHPIDMIH